jgi:hypothetical protein
VANNDFDQPAVQTVRQGQGIESKRKHKRKMAQKFLSGPFFMILVRLAGIEPTTPWFVAKYSIQLSYSRDKRKYISFGRNGKGSSVNASERM